MGQGILIRYGEIGLKGKNRPLFERRLAENVASALAGLGAGPVQRIFGRLLVEIGPEHMPEALARLEKVFGIVGASPAHICPLSLEAVEEAALQEAGRVLAGKPVATFRIEARRPNKAFPHDSVEVARRVGAAVLRRFPQLKVDLSRPELTIYVEIRDRAAYVYSEGVKGPGGLPVGVSNRALLLLSGGIDSPVAGWMAASRGIEVEAIHFHSFPFTSEGAQQKALDLAALLSEWTGRMLLHMVHFTEVQKAIYQHVPPAMGVTVMRRFMMRISERVARARGIPVLLTGESVGQVASQTIESIAVIEKVVGIPILRPLIALDKQYIVERAQEIGSYGISVRPYEDCCTVFLAKHPETRPVLERVERAEAKLDVEGLVAGALATIETHRFSWGKPAGDPVRLETEQLANVGHVRDGLLPPGPE